MLFLFLQSVVPTVPASFLTFGDHPLYKFYETCRTCAGISALDDKQVAGLIMKIGAGFSSVGASSPSSSSAGTRRRGADARRARVSRDLDRELMGLQQQ